MTRNRPRSDLSLPGMPVYLRPPAEDDRGEFLARTNQSLHLHRPYAAAPLTDEAFAAYLLRNLRDDFEALLICRTEDHAIAGVINISQIFHGNFQSAYMGYYALRPFAGMGYMTAGMRLALRFAFGSLGLHRVEANIQPGNTASIALVRRLGFRLEGYSPRYLKVGGRWRDHERWALVAEDLGNRKDEF